MKNIFLTLVMGCMMIGGLVAQDYTTAAGLRLGSPFSISAKHFVSETDAFEVYTGMRFFDLFQSFSINGAYQVHDDFDFVELNIDNLRWYWGAGAGIHFWSFDDDFVSDDDFGQALSASGYLGLEITATEVPLVFTLDWVPTFFFGDTPTDRLSAGFGGISVRYIFKR